MFRSLLLKVTKEISRNIRSPQKTNERNSSITKIVKGESDVTKDKEDNKPNKLPQRILYDTNEILENHYSKGIYITAFSEVSQCEYNFMREIIWPCIDNNSNIFFIQYGFRLSNSICAIGPIVLFPRSVFHWNIESVAEISEESLCMFHIVTPKIDTLIIGAGDQQVQPAISKQIFNFMRKHKINVEIHPTEQVRDQRIVL